MENTNQENDETLTQRINIIETDLINQAKVLNICLDKWYAIKGMLAEADESNIRTQRLFILAMKKLGIPFEEEQGSSESGQADQTESQSSTTEIDYRPPVKQVVEKRVGNVLDSMRNPGRRNGYRQGY